MAALSPVVAALGTPLQAALLAIIANPTIATVEAQGIKLPGEEVAAALQAQPQLLTFAAAHLLSALNSAVSAAPTVSTSTTPTT